MNTPILNNDLPTNNLEMYIAIIIRHSKINSMILLTLS